MLVWRDGGGVGARSANVTGRRSVDGLLTERVVDASMRLPRRLTSATSDSMADASGVAAVMSSATRAASSNSSIESAFAAKAMTCPAIVGRRPDVMA